MKPIVNKQDLPGTTARQFEGYLYGGVPVSFFLSDTPPGRGPSLHIHPYAEIFILHAGTLTFQVGEETLEATAGQIIIVPAEVPHKFTNTGSAIAQHTDIHTCGQMETIWLEE